MSWFPVKRKVIKMENLKAFREANINRISAGEGIYIDMAVAAGVDPMTALKTMRDMLSAPWFEPEHFLADLGRDDPHAIIEALSHFGLPPRE